MTLALDHVVIAVNDLARSVEEYRALGFTVYPGGDHHGRSSHNALMVLADGSYLELKAWKSPAPEERWWRTLNASGEGLVDFALRTETPVEDLQAAQARGLLTLRGPVDGERIRPDGEHLKWTTARHDTADVAFLCGDITPRRLRVPDAPELLTHANGATGIEQLNVAVLDLDVSLSRWRALLGAHTAPAGIEEDAARGLRTARIALDGFVVILDSPAHTNGNAQLAQHLATRGEGPYAMRLRGVSAPWNDPAAAHGFVPVA